MDDDWGYPHFGKPPYLVNRVDLNQLTTWRPHPHSQHDWMIQQGGHIVDYELYSIDIFINC